MVELDEGDSASEGNHNDVVQLDALPQPGPAAWYFSSCCCGIVASISPIGDRHMAKRDREPAHRLS